MVILEKKKRLNKIRINLYYKNHGFPRLRTDFVKQRRLQLNRADQNLEIFVAITFL